LKIPPVFGKADPENVKDLQEMQAHVRRVLRKVIPCTVAICQAKCAVASGVVISKEGYVLTAAHVSSTAGREYPVILPGGKVLKGETLGANRAADIGLIKITDKYTGPWLEIGQSADLKQGDWVIATGHAGGYKEGRSPPVRFGRVLEVNGSHIRTDCPLVGGDSGGPLIDMRGKVVGVHRSIGADITSNVHAPVDAFRKDRERIVKGEVWGRSGSPERFPYLGIALRFLLR
jgi:serine protease Do